MWKKRRKRHWRLSMLRNDCSANANYTLLPQLRMRLPRRLQKKFAHGYRELWLYTYGCDIYNQIISKQEIRLRETIPA